MGSLPAHLGTCSPAYTEHPGLLEASGEPARQDARAGRMWDANQDGNCPGSRFAPNFIPTGHIRARVHATRIYQGPVEKQIV